MNRNDALFQALSQEHQLRLSRRTFLGNSAAGIGLAALGSLTGAPSAIAAAKVKTTGGLPNFPDITPKAKRVIYLFQSGAPSQMDLFDPKPQMEAERAKDLPESIRKGQRLTGMTSGQKSFPIAP